MSSTRREGVGIEEGSRAAVEFVEVVEEAGLVSVVDVGVERGARDGIALWEMWRSVRCGRCGSPFSEVRRLD